MKADRPFLFRNAIIYDGTGGPPRQADLLYQGGKIQALANALPLPAGGHEILLDGCCLSPGWVDLHTHVFEDHGIFSVPPHEIGLSAGVTTLVDAGSAGALNYPVFVRNVVNQARERIVGYVNIASGGILHGHAEMEGFVGDHFHPALHSEKLAIALLTRYSDSIVGWKIRLTAVLADHNSGWERDAFAALLRVKAETGRPVMVHHVKSSLGVDEVLNALREGDVYTHCFHGYENSPFEESNGLPKAVTRAARDRGVRFDVGHGSGSFRWSCAEMACRDGGFWPDTISSDLHRYNIFSPVRDLATTMTKFLLLGAPLEKIVAMVTGNTSAALTAVGGPASLKVGSEADLTLFKIQEGNFSFGDCQGQQRPGSRRIVPLGVVKGGELSPCYGFHSRESDSDAFAQSWQETA